MSDARAKAWARLRFVVRPSIIVTCVKSKHGQAVFGTSMHELGNHTSACLAREWMTRVLRQGDLTARALYKGLAWGFVRKAEEACRDATFYVASAGYGLVNFDVVLAPYQASFSPGPDRVASRISMEGSVADRHRHWWNDLNDICLGSGNPISDLADAPVVVVAGSHYLDALQDDLRGAAIRLGTDGLLIVVIGERRLPIELQACALVVPSAARTTFRVPLSALGPRVLLWLCEEIAPSVKWSINDVRRAALDKLQQSQTIPRSDRRRLTDEEVTSWISERARAGRALSCSALLRELRDSGLACEQSRFGSLYRKASSSAEGQ